MRFFFPAAFLVALGILFLPAISSAEPQDPSQETTTADEEQDLAAELRDSQQQLELSHLRMSALLTGHNLDLLTARAEIATAKLQLQLFLEFDAALETANGLLELDYAKDSLADSEEELEQLSIMYDRNALASATAQIVMERAARSIERQKASVAIQEKMVAGWNAMGLAARQQELQQQSILAQASLEATLSSQELETVELQMEIDELKSTVQDLKAKLAAQNREEDAESEG